MKIDTLKLLMGRPLTLNKEYDIKVKQPLISEIVDLGEDNYNRYLRPFVITTEFIFNGLENEEKLINQFDLYDLFFINDEKGNSVLNHIFDGHNALDVIKESLSFFLDTNDIQILQRQKVFGINGEYSLNKNEFSKMKRIVQAITRSSDIEVDKPPKNMTKKQRDIWKKLQKGRKRQSEKNAIYTQDIINYVSFGGKNYISKNQIDEMTYYELRNAYKSILGIDSFNIALGYKLSEKYEVKEDIKHWTETLKIGK
ncbi:AMP-binding protein [Virgibacillus sp. M23]|uniref:AMP-binding protein n=1 Tax=Virgibacillus sp. M23 TaxID=3079030 RepID=UPI002A917CC7|nr:AMP-binding protein [Virgibacillus sp. M23]MDY7043687.1 AMP-binding protein [Virgibacillus sp. M23]